MNSCLALCVLFAGSAFGMGWQGYRLGRARELHWVSKRNGREYEGRSIAFVICVLLLLLGIRFIEWLSGPLDLTNAQSYVIIIVFVLAVVFAVTIVGFGRFICFCSL